MNAFKGEAVFTINVRCVVNVAAPLQPNALPRSVSASASVKLGQTSLLAARYVASHLLAARRVQPSGGPALSDVGNLSERRKTTAAQFASVGGYRPRSPLADYRV